VYKLRNIVYSTFGDTINVYKFYSENMESTNDFVGMGVIRKERNIKSSKLFRKIY